MMNQKIKMYLKILFILIGIISYLYFIMYNEYGIKKYYSLKKELLEKEKIVTAKLKQFEQKKSEQEIYIKSTFAKEKIAREDLLMGYTNETVYVFK